MFRTIYQLLLIFLCFSIWSGCASGKKAYEHGDYITAVRQAVERLRQKPEHSKSIETLRLAYPLAVEYLESQAKSTIESDAPFRWKKAMGYYTEINQLHDQVQTSPAALKIIKNPETRYKEIAELKKKAADESYEAGIQAMMKNTRSEAIRAYYLFKEANDYEPGIKDVVELQYQAEYNATLRIVYTEQIYRNDWVAVQPVVNSLNLPFTKFYTNEQAQAENVPIHHLMLIEILGYTESNPVTSRTENNFVDSILVDRTVGEKKIKVKEAITGRSTLFEKRAMAQGIVRVTIKEKESSKQLMSTDFTGVGQWADSWARCSGDARAIPDRIRRICSKPEPMPDSQQMLKQARLDTQRQIERSLSSFYRL